jgi:hypothetical protein
MTTAPIPINKDIRDLVTKDKIESGLLDVRNGRIKAINPDGGKVTREQLSKALWS